MAQCKQKFTKLKKYIKRKTNKQRINTIEHIVIYNIYIYILLTQ